MPGKIERMGVLTPLVAFWSTSVGRLDMDPPQNEFPTFTLHTHVKTICKVSF